MTTPNLDEILKNNPDAPTTDEYALHLARKLFPPREQRTEGRLVLDLSDGPTILAAADEEEVDYCGESTRGVLEATMHSSLISDHAKAAVERMIEDSLPTLEHEKIIGHFRFRWTDSSSDPRDNVTEADIDATGVELNSLWSVYATNFREPKAALVGGVRMIDVDVYFDPGLHGSTSSATNRIFLNSQTVVSDPCRRRTTSAHELFHRVQYSYGYITGTAGQRWWVEALGSWSQEHTHGDVQDYVNRVNAGLNVPDRDLLQRSYDACHYWKYLGEQLRKRSGSIASEGEAIRVFLDTYSNNGKDAKAASQAVTQSHLSRDFDRFFQDWTKTNVLKDLDNPGLRYEYDEDETVHTSCGRTYGPYRHILPVANEVIANDAFVWTSATQNVSTYGSDHFSFTIDPSVTKIGLRFEGNPPGGGGVFSVHVVMIKNNRWRVIYNRSHVTEHAHNLAFAAAEYDRMIVLVNGLGTGGQYELSINACMLGVWRDSFNFLWTLAQSGGDLTGTCKTPGCGIYSVTGTLNGGNLKLKATGACCDFEYAGSVTDCQEGSGSWSNDCGGSGSWTMRRTDAEEALAANEAEEIEVAQDPTSRPIA